MCAISNHRIYDRIRPVFSWQMPFQSVTHFTFAFNFKRGTHTFKKKATFCNRNN